VTVLMSPLAGTRLSSEIGIFVVPSLRWMMKSSLFDSLEALNPRACALPTENPVADCFEALWPSVKPRMLDPVVIVNPVMALSLDQSVMVPPLFASAQILPAALVLKAAFKSPPGPQGSH